MVSSLSAKLRSTLSLDQKYENLLSEIWRIVFSFLKAKDLCRCQCVCKDWKNVVTSIDTTRWKELYLLQKKYKRWKHPFWPNEDTKDESDIKSWQKLYKQRILESRKWILTDLNASCTAHFFFKRKRENKILPVGLGKSYLSVKSALDAASAYDIIYIYPGNYQQPSTLHIKCPVALLGVGKPDDITLTMQINVQVESVKFENLTIKPVYPRLRAGRGRNPHFPLIKVGPVFQNTMKGDSHIYKACFKSIRKTQT